MRHMQDEATAKGFYRLPLGRDYPKIQIINVEELLQGTKPEVPLPVDPVQVPPAKSHKEQTTKML